MEAERKKFYKKIDFLLHFFFNNKNVFHYLLAKFFYLIQTHDGSTMQAWLIKHSALKQTQFFAFFSMIQ